MCLYCKSPCYYGGTGITATLPQICPILFTPRSITMGWASFCFLHLALHPPPTGPWASTPSPTTLCSGISMSFQHAYQGYVTPLLKTLQRFPIFLWIEVKQVTQSAWSDTFHLHFQPCNASICLQNSNLLGLWRLFKHSFPLQGCCTCWSSDLLPNFQGNIIFLSLRFQPKHYLLTSLPTLARTALFSHSRSLFGALTICCLHYLQKGSVLYSFISLTIALLFTPLSLMPSTVPSVKDSLRAYWMTDPGINENPQYGWIYRCIFCYRWASTPRLRHQAF